MKTNIKNIRVGNGKGSDKSVEVTKITEIDDGSISGSIRNQEGNLIDVGDF